MKPDAQNILALLLILGMLWKITSNIVRASDKLADLEKRVTHIEKKIGVTTDG